MDRYYYIASQLPLLQFNSDNNITQEELFYEVDKWLSSKDLIQLKQADLSATIPAASDTEIVKKYKEFEYLLRSDLKAWRNAQKDGYEHKTMLVPLSLLKESNPLQIEQELLKLRWDHLEEIGLEHYFDIEFLLVYNYKLQILDRLKSFDKETGIEKFKQYTKVGI